MLRMNYQFVPRTMSGNLGSSSIQWHRSCSVKMLSAFTTPLLDSFPVPQRMWQLENTEDVHFAIIDITNGKNTVLEDLEGFTRIFTLI